MRVTFGVSPLMNKYELLEKELFSMHLFTTPVS